MAKSILDIIIKLSKEGGADRDTIRGLVDIKKSAIDVVGTFAAVAGAAYAVDKGLQATVGAFAEYADQVRTVQFITGASADESSRLIQLADDAKISYEELAKAMQLASKQGITPNVAGLAQLSDAYLKLMPGQERENFLLKEFGKNGTAMAELMSQGSAAIRERAAAVEQGLILDEAALRSARIYEIELDNLNDKIQAIKITAGQGIVELITGETADVQRRAQQLFQLANGYELNTNQLNRLSPAQRASWEEARKQAENEWLVAHGMDAAAVATGNYGQTAEEAAAQAKALTQHFQETLGLIKNIQSANETYEKSAKDLADERIKIEKDRAAAIAQGWSVTSEKIQDYDRALDENAQKAEENAAKHHEAMGKIQFDLLVTKLSVDGITDAEYGMIEQAGLTFGVFDQESIDAARNMDLVTDAVVNHKAKLQDVQTLLAIMAKGYSIDVAIKIAGQQALQDLQNQLGGTQGKKAVVGNTKRAIGGPAGGFTWVGERGPELVDLPSGSYVHPASESARMAGAGNVIVNIAVSSAVSIMDEAKAKQVLIPMIIEGVKQAQANGIIRK